MNSRGFTLLEMVMTVAVMGILLAIGYARFRDYSDRAGIEKVARELRTNISVARMSAMQNGQRRVLFMGPNSYTQYRNYSSLNESLTSATRVVVDSYSYPYTVKRKTGATLTNLNSATDCIDFDPRGFTVTANCANSNMTLVVTPVTYGRGNNCVVVDTVRTTIGRMENVSTCRIR